jgi:hypothetical protein
MARLIEWVSRMSAESAARVGFGPCCFCGEIIEETDVDPCRLTVETSGKKWQVWYTHAMCFRERLNLDNPEIDLTPVFF